MRHDQAFADLHGQTQSGSTIHTERPISQIKGFYGDNTQLEQLYYLRFYKKIYEHNL